MTYTSCLIGTDRHYDNLYHANDAVAYFVQEDLSGKCHFIPAYLPEKLLFPLEQDPPKKNTNSIDTPPKEQIPQNQQKKLTLQRKKTQSTTNIEKIAATNIASTTKNPKIKSRNTTKSTSRWTCLKCKQQYTYFRKNHQKNCGELQKITKSKKFKHHKI